MGDSNRREVQKEDFLTVSSVVAVLKPAIELDLANQWYQCISGDNRDELWI